MEKTREHSTLEQEISTALILLGKRIPRVLTGEPTEIPISINGESITVTLESLSPLTFTLGGRRYEVSYEESIPLSATSKPSPTNRHKPFTANGQVCAPIAGVVSSILCKVGEKVTAKSLVLRLEAMKMQNGISASKEGTLTAILVSEGQEVSAGDPLFEVG